MTHTATLKDHQIAALVNELRDIALKYHDTQQLRERIAQAVLPALRAADRQQAPEGVEIPEALRLASWLETADVTEMDLAIDQAAAELRRLHARIAELEDQLESIGAGGANGPLMGSAFTAADMPEGITRDDTVHGETYYTAADMATASAQGFRDGVASLAASAGSDGVASISAAEPAEQTDFWAWVRRAYRAPESTSFTVHNMEVAYQALRASHGQAPAQSTPLEFTKEWCMAAAKAEEDSGADISAGVPVPPQAAQQAPAERSVQRMDGWTDTRYITELENVVRLLRRDLEKLHKVREALSDCSGGQPCSTCPDKKACQRGCVRQEEFISTEYHAQQRSRAAQQAPAGATASGLQEQHDRDSRELRSLCESRDQARRERDELRALIDANRITAHAAPSTPASGGWMPIETAPKDGTEILLYAPPQEYEGKPIEARKTYGKWLAPSDTPHINYQDGFAPEVEFDDFDAHWSTWDGGFTPENPPTHWQPLPASPTIEGESNG